MQEIYFHLSKKAVRNQVDILCRLQRYIVLNHASKSEWCYMVFKILPVITFASTATLVHTAANEQTPIKKLFFTDIFVQNMKSGGIFVGKCVY